MHSLSTIPMGLSLSLFFISADAVCSYVQNFIIFRVTITVNFFHLLKLKFHSDALMVLSSTICKFFSLSKPDLEYWVISRYISYHRCCIVIRIVSWPDRIAAALIATLSSLHYHSLLCAAIIEHSTASALRVHYGA